MKFLNIIAAITFIFSVKNSYSQTTILDFTKTPQTYAGNGTYNPNYFDNSGGCSHNFGPNPLSVNGYNIRSIGASNISPVFRNTSTTYLWRLDGWGNTKTGQRCNVVISVEYPFKANKTYEIELNGINDHYSTSPGSTTTIYNGVFWIKLDDNPALITNNPNPCKEWYAPVEKSVGRYSKLIADPSIAIEDKTYRVKLSPLQAKSALKIFFDTSPIADGIIIDQEFYLKNIKITEIPYEEESGRYNSTYLNVPFPTRGTLGYDIPIILDNPSNQPGRIVTSVTANPNQWSLNSNGVGYSIKLSQLIQNLKSTQLVNISLLTDRPIRGNPGPPNLPCTYIDNYYSFTSSNDDVVINITNPTNTAPNAATSFNITYNNP